MTTEDAAPTPAHDSPTRSGIEIIEARSAEVGGFGVRRVLPRRTRRTVGAWCFVDHIGPGEVSDRHRLDVAPHPHIGLQTVTWLLEGALVHRDSLGSEQLIRPGELNVMTAGHGVAHSEETDGFRGALQGVQLWVAQPSATRDGAPSFEHHATLPELEVGTGTARVLVGDFSEGRSPARRDTEHVGVDLELRTGRYEVPLRPDFEHAIVVLEGRVRSDSSGVEPGQLGYLGIERDQVVLECDSRCRLLLLGGVPLSESVLIWWNYVARTREEIRLAHRDWSTGSGRFGRVVSSLPRLDGPALPWPVPGS